MTEILSGLPVGQLGAGALLAIGVLLILTGRLVPRQVLLDIQKSADADAEAVKILVAAVSKMTVYAETTDKALRDIQAAVERAAEERAP